MEGPKSGFEQMKEELQNAREILAGLSRKILMAPTNNQPETDRAIRFMEETIDASLVKYMHNPVVATIAEDTKARFREALNQKSISVKRSQDHLILR